MRKLFFLAGLLLAHISGNAQTPKWSTDVAPILYNRCTQCHHSGGIAPFALMTYPEASAMSASIKTDVQDKKMPPWPPDPNYSHLAHERVLSAAEINTIVNWVDAGSPSGDLSLAPPAPVYSNTGVLPGTPDLVIKIPNYVSTASSGDVYQCFTIPSGMLVDKYITGFEAIPGNTGIVHHVLVFSDTTGTCASLDAASPGPGYPNFGGVGTSDAIMIGGWVPGGQPITLPTGFGVRLANHADIVLQIHYPAGSAGQTDSTEVHFFFAPASASVRNVYINPPLYHYAPVINAPLFIPANTTQTFTETMAGIPLDASLLGVAPHMHLIGRSIKSYGIPLTGDTIKLIDIPDWDFHWQGFYLFPKIKKIPAGTTLKAEAFYDNTSANPENPNSPPQDVSVGEATTDEMMLVFMVYTYYQPGDENIIIDSGILTNNVTNYYRGQQLLEVTPNPAVTDIVMKCYMEEADRGTVEVVDMLGKVVKQLMNNEPMKEGYSAHSYNVAGLPQGTYIVRLRTSQRILSQKIIIR
jgi:hypothetical protein